MGNGIPTLTIKNGSYVQQAVLQFGTYATQVISLYPGRDYAEFEYTIGPIDISDNLGKEIITRFSTDLETKNTFYTDANGREMQTRVINFRPTWPIVVFEPVAGNYYPVNSAAYIRDESRNVQLTILTDRSQGGGSVVDGDLEVMLHRRLLADDGRGVGEPLNETAFGHGLIIKTRHYVFFDTPDSSSITHRIRAEQLANPLIPLFSNESSYASKHIGNYSAFSSLPPNIHLQTLQQLDEHHYLLRLNHLFESAESPTYNGPVTVSLSSIFFTVLGVTSAQEVSLSANQPVTDKKPMEWIINPKYQDNIVMPQPAHERRFEGDDYSVTIYPMQIRTFILA